MSEPNHRKVYAKGYYDGLNASQSKNEQVLLKDNNMMSRARFNEIYNSMSSVAKKAFDAVPIEKPWSASMILSEMQRNGGSSDYRIVSGAINTLKNAKLILEPTKGEFIRSCVKPELMEKSIVKPVINETKEEMKMSVIIAKPALAQVDKQKEQNQSKTSIDRMGELSAKLSILADSVKQLATEINDTAVAIEEDIEESAENSAKMNQLKTLLKSLG